MTNVLSGKYAIAGFSLIVGIPENDLAKRRNTCTAQELDNIVPSPLAFTGRDLEAEAVRRAIEDAGLEGKDIDGAVHVIGGPKSWQVMQHNDAFPRMLGLPVNFHYLVWRGGASGTFSIATALSFLELGVANYIVVAGAREDWTQSHRSEFRDKGFVGRVNAQKRVASWGEAFGEIAAAHSHSLLATRHMHDYGTTSQQLGSVATQIRAWACKNPYARMYGKPATLDDYENSPMHVWPYHLMDMSVTSDGAVAMVLTTTERARSCPKPPISILGLGFGDAQGGQWWEGAGNYTKLPVSTAKKAALGQAGIDLKDIDVAQLYDCFTTEVILQLEDYGWCSKGEGGPYVQEGHIGPGGDTPINTSGGLLSAYHLGDLTCISESILQLRGEAGQRQIKDATLCLSSGHGGETLSPGMCSTHATMVLGRI
jgi:acetyl-CoA acetyltransferase